RLSSLRGCVRRAAFSRLVDPTGMCRYRTRNGYPIPPCARRLAPVNIGAVTSVQVQFVVVSGPPGRGKTTLATALAAELDLPLISKDAIKVAMLSVLTVSDSAASQELGRASMAVLYQLAKNSRVGAILKRTSAAPSPSGSYINSLGPWWRSTAGAAEP